MIFDSETWSKVAIPFTFDVVNSKVECQLLINLFWQIRFLLENDANKVMIFTHDGRVFFMHGNKDCGFLLSHIERCTKLLVKYPRLHARVICSSHGRILQKFNDDQVWQLVEAQ